MKRKKVSDFKELKKKKKITIWVKNIDPEREQDALTRAEEHTFCSERPIRSMFIHREQSGTLRQHFRDGIVRVCVQGREMHWVPC